MKHLNRFKTFESVNLEDWETLVDVLQSDIFDEWNIHKIKDEIFDGNENDPDYKLWAFRTNRGTLSSELTSDVNTLSIYNIPLDEANEFWNALMEVKSFLLNVISKGVVITEEPFGNIDSGEHIYNDYDIKLVDL